jgi:hypothetical protein
VRFFIGGWMHFFVKLIFLYRTSTFSKRKTGNFSKRFSHFRKKQKYFWHIKRKQEKREGKNKKIKNYF